MVSFFRKYRKYIIILFIVLAFLQYISFKIKKKYELTSIDKTIIYLVAPLEKISSDISKEVIIFLDSYVFISQTKKELTFLREENKDLIKKINELEVLKATNKEFSKMLEFKKSVDFHLLSANVINKNSGPLNKTITIDIGETDGVKKDMAILSYDGVVGKVIDVLKNYSTVLLITDGNSACDGQILRDGTIGIVRGTSLDILQLKLDYVSKEKDIQVNDIVVTSGIGKIWPKGQYIGKIAKINKNREGFFQEIILNPSVNFAKLDRVFVVTEK